MNPIDVKLHAALIRSARGMINAWEEWVYAQLPPPKVEENPDPQKHFEQVAKSNNFQTRRK
jgi:hypothetical protein